MNTSVVKIITFAVQVYFIATRCYQTQITTNKYILMSILNVVWMIILQLIQFNANYYYLLFI